MSYEPVISLSGISKCYHIYDKPRDRLLQMLFRGRKKYFREFWAVRDVSLQLGRGDVVGIIGRNGAGKSTLLQMICGTLAPTAGSIAVQGRVSALLELGAGFNPEFTGRENVYLAGMVMGLTQDEISARYDEIVRFSGIAEFIEQPVKTYSSGMYMRLAFSVATCFGPDILVVDEALSVGDGEFGRKSFDRIMELKDQGTTILFCSHSLYQVEAFCNQVLWLEKGTVRMSGEPARVTSAYQATLDGQALSPVASAPVANQSHWTGRIDNVSCSVDGVGGTGLRLTSLESSVAVTVNFSIDPGLPDPSVAIGIANEAGITISSASSVDDNVQVGVDSTGKGQVTIVFPNVPLLKGTYYVTAFLGCENALHAYDFIERAVTLQVAQKGLTQGVVELPHHWLV